MERRLPTGLRPRSRSPSPTSPAGPMTTTRAALAAFRRGAAVLAEHPPKRRADRPRPARRWPRPSARAAALPADIGRDAARALLRGELRRPRGRGRTRAARSSPATTSRSSPARGAPPRRFPTPLYAPPADLVEIDPDNPPPGIEPGYRFARQDGGRARRPIPTAATIERGALRGQRPRDRLARRPGRRLLHPRPGLGPPPPRRRRRDARHLCRQDRPPLHVDRPRADRAWARCRKAARPCRRSAPGSPRTRTRRRRSWRGTAPSSSSARRRSSDPALGPIAAAKVPLTAGRSLAVDRLIHSFDTPVWVETTLPRRRAVAPADGRAGHRLGDRRPGARRHLLRLRRRGRRGRRRDAEPRPLRRPLSRARPHEAGPPRR